jgi:hypothetical protein
VAGVKSIDLPQLHFYGFGATRRDYLDRMTPSFAPSSLVPPFARGLACRGNRLGFAEY